MQPDQFEDLQVRADKLQAALSRLQDANPGASVITLFVMANDELSIEVADKYFAEGWSFERAAWLCGSFARMGWAYRQWVNAKVDDETFFRLLPELWRGSDPDDTDRAYLEMWARAHELNGYETVTDGDPLPKPDDDGYLTVYRGQEMVDDNVIIGWGEDHLPLGIAWSTSEAVAQKFANGAGVRASLSKPIVYKARVLVQDVFAYLTGRNEHEVILNPEFLRSIDDEAQ